MFKPKIREECTIQKLAVDTPCPFLTCKYHLLLESKHIINRLYKWERFIKRGEKWEWMDIPITDEEILLILENLPPRKSCTLEMASWGPITLQEIAELYGVTRERIRQIAHNEKQDSGAIAKLQKSWRAQKLLEDYK